VVIAKHISNAAFAEVTWLS